MKATLANIGYLAAAKQPDDTTVSIPDIFIPLYGEGLNTNLNLEDQTPIYGEKFETFDVLQGIRSHRGDVTVLAEPNTSLSLAAMLLTLKSTTGSGPYVHTLELDRDTDPTPHTIDVSTGKNVTRYIGAQASNISPDIKGSEIKWKVSISALKSFSSRKLAGTPTGSGPYTVTLDTDYDPEPTVGLVEGDLIQFKKADGTTINAEVLDVTSVTQFTTTTNVSTLAATSVVRLRPQDPTYDLLKTLTWPRTQFRFADDAATALTAAQTRVEQGSTYEFIHNFDNEDGAQRSGGYDPDTLDRTTGKATVNITKLFEGGKDIDDAQALKKSALVVRHFAGNSGQYEVRAIFNHLKTDGTIIPDLEPGAIEMSDIQYRTVNDQTDGKGMQMVIINDRATL